MDDNPSIQRMREAAARERRFDATFRSMYYGFARERGYTYDRLLNTTSHSVLALRIHFSSHGV